jgi:H+-transporting ATPase
MTIYLTRTRGPFWSIRPARKLIIAVMSAEIIATVVSVAGIFVTRLPWEYALLVWGYALAWFLLTDRVKLLAYRILDPAPPVAPGTPAGESAAASNKPAAGIDPSSNGAAMKRAYHTTSVEYLPSHRNVYHTDDACPYGSEINASHREEGTGGHELCRHCAAQ